MKVQSKVDLPGGEQDPAIPSLLRGDREVQSRFYAILIRYVSTLV